MSRVSIQGFSQDALGAALRDIIDHTADADAGSDRTVFALVSTRLLAELEPGAVAEDDTSELSPILQEIDDLDDFLARAAWPEQVVGAAISMDIVVVPPKPGEPGTPRPARPEDDVDDAGDRRSARLAVGVLRDGPRLAVMRLYPEADGSSADDGAADELLTHPELAVELRDALAATFAPDI
ncbi:PPA1309 family protein [Gordonia sp. ABSL1-1]|uniref:PPA1309 family protein n=1 Tax=Gordonia sp. ABSL1-1 TaxID=3053923 RepID=UPI0025728AA0|nr:PPA1309 family protein [Gordonia sp. ABSL1-1]MDL9936807.1 PPA1309 family protein [Gordonia sp. ABSL1-1]